MIAREESRDERGLTISRSVASLAAARSPAAPPPHRLVRPFSCFFIPSTKVCGARRWKAGSETVHAIV